MNKKIVGEKLIYLHPGEVCYSNKDIIVSTVLGSCLAITMYNKRINFGCISHCMLPKCKDQTGGCGNCADVYKYVDCTIKKMLEKFREMDVKKEDIEVKIFGGADILKTVNTKSKTSTIGAQNIETALKTFERYKLKLVSSDVGGIKGRRIFFKTITGEVFLKRLKKYAED